VKKLTKKEQIAEAMKVYRAKYGEIAHQARQINEAYLARLKEIEKQEEK